ncbi:RNA ligase/cyclic nucleotide phosphodiesterase [Bisporella sp. PMI_857]|nr:RNA ligase/cyclic nucleotide phosphodiesterase [Bisporella sp. PMI_857]
MPPTLPGSVDASNKFEDLSGVDITLYKNPYDALIEACQNDPSLIQSRYETHRSTRNGQQKEKLLAPDFSGLIIDPILQKLQHPSLEPGFQDPRHCLVFWARPPAHIRELARRVQQKLSAIASNLWLMPLERMHLTALEITHSLTDPEIHSIVDAIGPEAIAAITDYTYTHRARLINPMVSYDGAALALSFLPTSPLPSSSPSDPNFTYHHLRRDLYNLASRTGVSVDSRYVVPSSHITLARFLVQDDHDSPEKMKAFLDGVDSLNSWLQEMYWPSDGNDRVPEGDWIVGEEKGLDCREGQLWYGGGRTVRLGKGFEREQ